MKCVECKGQGRLECDDQSEWVNTTQYYTCPMCSGSGKAPRYCPDCGQPVSGADGDKAGDLNKP